MSREKIKIETEVNRFMTNIEAATCLVELHSECEVRLRNVSRELTSNYAEAVAMAIMALGVEEIPLNG